MSDACEICTGDGHRHRHDPGSQALRFLRRICDLSLSPQLACIVGERTHIVLVEQGCHRQHNEEIDHEADDEE